MQTKFVTVHQLREGDLVLFEVPCLVVDIRWIEHYCSTRVRVLWGTSVVVLWNSMYEVLESRGGGTWDGG